MYIGYKTYQGPEFLEDAGEMVDAFLPYKEEFVMPELVFWDLRIDAIGGGYYFYPVSNLEVAAYKIAMAEGIDDLPYNPWHRRDYGAYTRLGIDEAAIPRQLYSALEDNYDCTLNRYFEESASFNPWGDNIYTVDAFERVIKDFKRMSGSDGWCEYVCRLFKRVIRVTEFLNQKITFDVFDVIVTGP